MQRYPPGPTTPRKSLPRFSTKHFFSLYFFSSSFFCFWKPINLYRMINPKKSSMCSESYGFDCYFQASTFRLKPRRLKGRPQERYKHVILLFLQTSLYDHRQRPYGLLGTGAQDGHLDFHTVPELCDTTVQCCFTSTETVRTIKDGESRTATSTFTQFLNSERRVPSSSNVALRPQKP